MHNAGGIRLSATPRTMLDISLILIADVIELYASIDFKSHLFFLHSTFFPPCSCVCHAESSIFDRLTECNLLLPYISTLHLLSRNFLQSFYRSPSLRTIREWKNGSGIIRRVNIWTFWNFISLISFSLSPSNCDSRWVRVSTFFERLEKFLIQYLITALWTISQCCYLIFQSKVTLHEFHPRLGCVFLNHFECPFLLKLD